MKVAIVGGGPSGLFCATLIRQRRPQWPVTVIEQNAAGATFGFGVVLADTGLNRLRQAAPGVIDRLIERMVFTDRQAIVTRDQPVVVKRPRTGGAIARLDLLAILQEAARAAGVDVRFGERIADPAALDADVVIGADGINSTVRQHFAAAFGTTRTLLTNRFAWYGTTKVFANPALVFRKLGRGGIVAHYYPYSPTASTFVGEIDEIAWNEHGMDAMSDEQRKALVESVFAPELDGHPLISANVVSNSVWRQFPVIRNRVWSVERNVLIGDAHASAHFSIGSGTRIAMEDAVDLAEALTAFEPADVPARLAEFAARRGPQKAKLIDASERSYLWYERIAEWIDRYDPRDFVYAFMTRTGRVDDARLAADFPELFAYLRDTPSAA